MNSLLPLLGVNPPSEVDRPPTTPTRRQTNMCLTLQDESQLVSQKMGFNLFKPVQTCTIVQTVDNPTTFNRFQVLVETMEDDFETRLVGDSSYDYIYEMSLVSGDLASHGIVWVE